MKVAILTGGGDAPGMNAFIRAAARAAMDLGWEAVGVDHAYDGLIDGSFMPLDDKAVSGIINRGGSIIGCGRSKRFRTPEGQQQAIQAMRDHGVEALVVCGGDGSLAGALRLHDLGVRVVGAPGSIDNDVAFTDMSIGVDTAINTTVEAIDRLRDTAMSHHRCFIVEVMGRESGYLAVASGLAAGADMVVVPEVDTSFEEILHRIQQSYERGRPHYIIVVAEGAALHAVDIHMAINESDNVFDSRISVLGHIVRGGRPSAYDRILAARMGWQAIETLREGVSGVMVGRQGRHFLPTPLERVIGEERTINLQVRDIAIAIAS